MSSTELTAELASLGSSALITSLAQVEAGGAYWTAQDEALVTYADKIQKHELDLEPDAPVADNVRRVQASSEPHPAKCNIAGKTVRVLKACLADSVVDTDSVAEGDVVFAGKRLYFVCKDGRLEVECLQPAGKKPMDAKAFAAGNSDVREGRAKWSAIND
jgi:methionyl-tRNA formyltransferase